MQQPAPAVEPSHSISIKRSWRQHPTIRFLSLVIVLWAIYIGYGYLSGPSRRTDRLNQILAQSPPSLDLLVTSKFPPEEFHIQLYQQMGNMRGVEGHTAKLHGVSSAHTRSLSRYYWIEQIDLAQAN